jgi:hypothetical protein
MFDAPPAIAPAVDDRSQGFHADIQVPTRCNFAASGLEDGFHWASPPRGCSSQAIAAGTMCCFLCRISQWMASA